MKYTDLVDESHTAPQPNRRDVILSAAADLFVILSAAKDLGPICLSS